MNLDLAIFGGGVSGLWLLAAARERGYRVVLIESGQLGGGQTICAQGILHAGLKYRMGFRSSRKSLDTIREMPPIWNECLSRMRSPSLTSTRVHTSVCHIWWTRRLASSWEYRISRLLLRDAPRKSNREDYPEALEGHRGIVAKVRDQAISPQTLVANLSSLHKFGILYVPTERVDFLYRSPGRVDRIRLNSPGNEQTTIDLVPRRVVFVAGAGNESLRSRIGLTTPRICLRPQMMTLVRGRLPVLHWHCVDGGSPLKPSQRVFLKDGDELRFGSGRWVFRIELRGERPQSKNQRAG